MNLCRHCGVEVEEDAQRCPLCRNPLRDGLDDERVQPDISHAPPEARRRIRRWLLEVVSLLAVTASVVVLVADLATGASLSWAHYPLASIGYLWLATALPLVLSGRGWTILAAEFAATGVFLLVLDRLAPGRAWFLPLALPVALLFGTFLATTLAFSLRRRPSPFAILSISMLAAGAFVMGLELLVNHYVDGRWSVSWSAVAFACDLPLVLLLLYLRKWYRQRQAELRKLFHV